MRLYEFKIRNISFLIFVVLAITAPSPPMSAVNSIRLIPQRTNLRHILFNWNTHIRREFSRLAELRNVAIIAHVDHGTFARIFFMIYRKNFPG